MVKTWFEILEEAKELSKAIEEKQALCPNDWNQDEPDKLFGLSDELASNIRHYIERSINNDILEHGYHFMASLDDQEAFEEARKERGLID